MRIQTSKADSLLYYLPAAAITGEVIASEWLKVSGFISVMVTVKGSECSRPRAFHTQIPAALTFNLNTFLIYYNRL